MIRLVTTLAPVTFVLVVYPTGKKVWQSLKQYRDSPEPGTYIDSDERKLHANSIPCR